VTALEVEAASFADQEQPVDTSNLMSEKCKSPKRSLVASTGLWAVWLSLVSWTSESADPATS
jgi:hypothetical protein